MARGLGAARHRATTTTSAPPSRVTSAPVAQLLQRRARQRPGRHLPRHLRGPLLRLVRGLLHRGRADRAACARSTSARSSAWSRRTTSSGSPPTRTGCSSTTRRTPRRSSPRPAATRCSRLIRGGLQDFSISRTTFDWGVPLPWDPKHVCYVWFDALTNYITAAGYAADPDRFARVWPANIHLIGKDILRFHAIYWPAMLMAGGVEPPDAGLGARLPHGRRQEDVEDQRSPGIHPFELLDHFGVDSYRYYFMREIQFGAGRQLLWESMVERHNADLANGLGNLASRVLAMLGLLLRRRGPRAGRSRAPSRDLPERDRPTPSRRYDEHMLARRALQPALGAVWEIVDAANHYLVEKEPWKLAKDETRRDELASVLYAVAETLRILAVLISPIMPAAAERPVEPARHRRPRSRISALPAAGGVGRPRGRDHDHERRDALPAAGRRVGVRGPSARPSSTTPPLGMRLAGIVFHVKLPAFDRMWRPVYARRSMSDQNPELAGDSRGGGYPLPPVPARQRTCRCGRDREGRRRRPADLRRRRPRNEPPVRSSWPIRSRVCSPRRACTPTTPPASTRRPAHGSRSCSTTPAWSAWGSAASTTSGCTRPKEDQDRGCCRPTSRCRTRPASRSWSTSATRGPTSFESWMRVRRSAW